MREIVLGADRVGVDDVEAVVGGGAVTLRFADGVEAAIRLNEREAAGAAAKGVVYGRTTGVGANRGVVADDHDGGHGLRLVRSHSAGGGRDLGDAVGRTTMLIRSHQLSTPGSGIPFEVVEALVRATNDGRSPIVREFGGVGTGDITVLGELALCLLGERPWRDGTTTAYLDGIGADAGLALMSSSAPMIAAAAVGLAELRPLVRASLVLTALGALGVRANPQHWSPEAASTRPSPGATAVADTMRRLLDGSRYDAARTQDPFGWRAAPFVGGPLLETLGEAITETERCIDSRVENPQYTADGVWHHGAFFLTSLAVRLDALRLALTQWLTLSLSRIVKLNDPAYTGQGRFLADGPAGSSGVMVLEYTAGSALGTVRSLADPATRHTLAISMGAEDHGSFSGRAAAALRESLPAVRTLLGCELLTALRAARSAVGVTIGGPLKAVIDACDDLPAPGPDRDLVDELLMAESLLDRLATHAVDIG